MTQNPFAALDDHDIDSHIGSKLLGRGPSAQHAETFLQAAQRLCEIRPRCAYWNHSVCHFIEKYGRDDRALPSLLDYLDFPFPQYRQALDLLVAAAFPDQNCLDRIVLPILRYNLARLAADPAATRFSYLAPAFRDPANLAVAESTFVKSDYGDQRGAYLMMDSATVQEFWERVRTVGVALYDSGSLGRYAGAPFSDEELAGYLEASHGRKIHERLGFAPAELARNLRTPISGRLEGVFIDVDGTLLWKDSLNEKLHSVLVDAMGRGLSPVVFSGGDPAGQAQRLANAGADVRLLTVLPKSDFRGKLLSVLIDDTEPALNGFGAETLLDPHCIEEIAERLLSLSGAGASM